MEAGRVYNFNPGPATLPLEVLKEAQAEFLNFNNSGMSILEISHRAPQYAAVHEKAKQDIKDLMGLGDDYEVLFCQGGASQQFAMIPLNYERTSGQLCALRQLRREGLQRSRASRRR